MGKLFPSIPEKCYFTIGEMSNLYGVKPCALRYWEREFIQLKPMKRRGNRRYYQNYEVSLIRRIREPYMEKASLSVARANALQMLELLESELLIYLPAKLKTTGASATK